MNTLLSWKRWLLLVRRQWHSDWKAFIILMGILMAVLAAFYGYNMPHEKKVIVYDITPDGYWVMPFPTVLLLLLGVALIALVSGSLFRSWRRKVGALEEIMLPASALEKFLVAEVAFWTCLALFLCGFFLIDGSFRDYFNHYYATHHFQQGYNPYDSSGAKFQNHQVLPFLQELRFKLGFGFRTLLLYGWVLHSFYLLGSIYFTKNPVLKSSGSIALILVVYVLALVKFYERVLYGKERIYASVTEMQQPDSTYHTFRSFWGIVLLLTALVCLRATYLKLKEKEI